MDSGIHAFLIDGVLTLPLYAVRGRTLAPIPSMGSGQVRLEYDDPDYSFERYSLSSHWLNEACLDKEIAKSIIQEWKRHFSNFLYFTQFKDDPTHEKLQSLGDHTDLVTALCDSRLGIDPSDLGTAFDQLFLFSIIHHDYRIDPERQTKYSDYAKKLEEFWGSSIISSFSCNRLIDRMVRQVEFSIDWSLLPVLSAKERTGKRKFSNPIKVFFSYSHVDSTMRDILDSHLSLLKREGFIETWHDRSIRPGENWETEISEQLNSANIIIMLISSHFISSEYCYGLELEQALTRDLQGIYRVRPRLSQ